jgi:hypothetical protein
MLGRAAPLVIAFALLASEVQASPECMTKQEARAKWPTKPIYSHGSSRCWNDQPLSSRRSTTTPTRTSDSDTNARAFDLSAPRPQATKTEVFLPSMTVNDIDLLNGAPMTGWRVLIVHRWPDWHQWPSARPEQRRRRVLLAITGCAEGTDRRGEMNSTPPPRTAAL